MEFPSNPVELPDCQLNWEFLKGLIPTFGTPIFATTGAVTGNGGGITNAGSGLFALDYTNNTGHSLLGFLFGTYRVDQAFTGSWVWGQSDLLVTGATLLTSGSNRGGYTLHGSGVFFVQQFMWGMVRIAKGASMHALVSARAQINGIHAWTATPDNDLSMFAWEEA
jgi:hypothetical protein